MTVHNWERMTIAWKCRRCRAQGAIAAIEPKRFREAWRELVEAHAQASPACGLGGLRVRLAEAGPQAKAAGR
jgi:hypothetical protein